MQQPIFNQSLPVKTHLATITWAYHSLSAHSYLGKICILPEQPLNYHHIATIIKFNISYIERGIFMETNHHNKCTTVCIFSSSFFSFKPNKKLINRDGGGGGSCIFGRFTKHRMTNREYYNVLYQVKPGGTFTLFGLFCE